MGPDDGWPGAGGDHRLRPGRAGRRRVRGPARRRVRPSRPGGSLGEVESTKSVSEIYAPVAGEVVAVNDGLTDAPEMLNATPTGRAGSARSSRSTPSRRTRCSTPRGYRQLTEDRARPPAEALGSARGSGYVGDVFCHNCGHRNPDGVNFCSSCGASMVTSAPDTSVSVSPVEDLGDGPDDEVPGRAARAPAGGRPAGGAAGERTWVPGSPRERSHHRRAAPGQRHLPRRHHGVAQARGIRDRGTR